jgi:serine O-acetyltransferase
VLPAIAQRIAMMTAQISIADAVVVQPGVFMPHGQVVIEGISEVQAGAVLFPWITIGLQGPGVTGPTIGAMATIGTGARVLGPVTVGKRARVGANAVVVDDVPDGVTVVGMPAKAVSPD